MDVLVFGPQVYEPRRDDRAIAHTRVLPRYMSVNSSRAAYIAATCQIGGNDIVIEHVGSIVRGAVHCKGNRTFRFRWSLQRPTSLFPGLKSKGSFVVMTRYFIFLFV